MYRYMWNLLWFFSRETILEQITLNKDYDIGGFRNVVLWVSTLRILKLALQNQSNPINKQEDALKLEFSGLFLRDPVYLPVP